MFLPMSWTSPFTVASTILPAPLWLEPPALLLLLHVGVRWATARFIARALLTTCGRNIFPTANRSPTIFMPSISGPSMTSSGRPSFCRASSASASMKSTMPCTRAWARRFSTVSSRQARSSSFFLPLPFTALGELDQALGRVGATIEHHVLDPFAQLGGDLLIDRELTRVDDAHVHAGLDRVVQEHRVHRLAHDVVAAERERQVGDAARDLHAGAGGLDVGGGLDERLAVPRCAPRCPSRSRGCWGRR